MFKHAYKWTDALHAKLFKNHVCPSPSPAFVKGQTMFFHLTPILRTSLRQLEFWKCLQSGLSRWAFLSIGHLFEAKNRVWPKIRPWQVLVGVQFKEPRRDPSLIELCASEQQTPSRLPCPKSPRTSCQHSIFLHRCVSEGCVKLSLLTIFISLGGGTLRLGWDMRALGAPRLQLHRCTGKAPKYLLQTWRKSSGYLDYEPVKNTFRRDGSLAFANILTDE